MARPPAHTVHRRHAWGFAWTSLGLALTVQVVDAAANGLFATPAGGHAVPALPWVSPASLTERAWLTLLMVTAGALLVLSPLALRGDRRLRPVAWTFAAAMLADAAAHLIGSALLWRPLPGVMSSPWLAATALWLISTLWRSSREA